MLGNTRRSGGSRHYVKWAAIRFLGKSSRPSLVLPSRLENFGSPAGDYSAIHSRMVGSGLCGGDFFPNPSSLFENVFCPESWLGEKEAYNRPLPSKSAFKEKALSDGRPLEHLKGPVQGPLGCKDRLEGRIPSCPSFNNVPEVLCFHPRESGFLFQGPSLWPVNGPLGIHKINEANKEMAEVSGYNGFLLSRRLFDSVQVLQGSPGAHQYGDKAPSEPGVFNKLDKVISCSEEGSRIPGNNHRFGELDFLPPRSQDYQTKISCEVHKEKFPFKKRTGFLSGIPFLRSRFPSPRKTVVEARSEMGEFAFLPSSQISENSFGQGTERDSRSLVVRGFSGLQMSSEAKTTNNVFDDRRLPFRLVRSSPPLENRGPLGDSSEGGAHKLVRIESYPPLSFTLPPTVEREMYLFESRQFNSIGMHKTPRLSEIRQALAFGQGAIGTVHVKWNLFASQTSKGIPERPCGQRIPLPPSSDGVVSGPNLLPRDLQESGDSIRRPLRDLGQPPAPDLRIPLSRPEGLDGGCVFVRLDFLEFYLRISTFSGPRGGGDAFNILQWGWLPDSPLLALKALVPPSRTQVPEEVPPPRRGVPVPGNERRDGRPPREFRFEAVRLDLIRSALLADGLSAQAVDLILSCHRPGTIRNYQSTWTKFLSFLTLERISHRDVKLAHVINFLSYELEQFHRAYRTIAGYKCALQLPLLFHLKLNIDSELTRRFLQGCYARIPPACGTRMPTWLLDDVLITLCSSAFEPIESVGDKQVFKKCLALLLLASGRRLSEIAALSRNSSRVGRRLWLEWIPSFRAKMDRADWRPRPPSILPSSGDGRMARLLCPVRAFQEYISRRNLIVNHVNNDLLWMVRQESLATTFRSLIKDSRRLMGKPINVISFPHQSKKLAVSYSFLYFNAHAKKLPALTGNKSLTVLKRSYAHEVPPLKYPVVLPLGTANNTFAG